MGTILVLLGHDLDSPSHSLDRLSAQGERQPTRVWHTCPLRLLHQLLHIGRCNALLFNDRTEYDVQHSPIVLPLFHSAM